MITTIAAAALAAAQPNVATPAPAGAQPQHDMHMPMDQKGSHEGMDCCKDCCKDKTAEHEAHDAEHASHSGR